MTDAPVGATPSHPATPPWLTHVEGADYARLDALAALGVSAYPHVFDQHGAEIVTARQFFERFDHVVKENGSVFKPAIVAFPGRLYGLRTYGDKLAFLDVGGPDKTSPHRVQIKLEISTWRDDVTPYAALRQALRVGDVVGFVGMPCRTKTGELSLEAYHGQLLTTNVRLIPPKLDDPERRARERSLDLTVNEHVRVVFETRSRIISSLRRFCEDRLRLMEVETPTLQMQAGALKLKMVMRISPELYLKMCIVGGLGEQGVYEIGKQFRNEDIDQSHSPEFTSIELYWRYHDYNQLMDMTSELFEYLARAALKMPRAAGDTTPLLVRAPDDGEPLMFTGPYPRISIYDALKEAWDEHETMGPHPQFPATDALDTADANAFFDNWATLAGVECGEPRTTARLLDKLIGHYIEPRCRNPTFVIDHPQLMCPLAKPHRSRPGLTERFELFICGREYVNAYTELNNPDDQRREFHAQLAAADKGDEEAQLTDEPFCRAIEYGLPPTAGWGMGIDRLVMLLTGQKKLADVLLFPAMRPLPQRVAPMSDAEILAKSARVAAANAANTMPPYGDERGTWNDAMPTNIGHNLTDSLRPVFHHWRADEPLPQRVAPLSDAEILAQADLIAGIAAAEKYARDSAYAAKLDASRPCTGEIRPGSPTSAADLIAGIAAATNATNNVRAKSLVIDPTTGARTTANTTSDDEILAQSARIAAANTTPVGEYKCGNIEAVYATNTVRATNLTLINGAVTAAGAEDAEDAAKYAAYLERPDLAAAILASPALPVSGKHTVVIKAETKSNWEGRCALAPRHVRELVQVHGLTVHVQRSATRAFSDADYAAAGATLVDKITDEGVVIGLKETPVDKMVPNRMYALFSHTFKGQPANMYRMDAFLRRNVTVIDYELIRDPEAFKRDPLTPTRAMKFGPYAGYGGLIDTLHGVGLRLLHLGYRTPFVHIGRAYEYMTLEDAHLALRRAGDDVQLHGLPDALLPFTVVFTSEGAVASAALEIFTHVQAQRVTPEELRTLSTRPLEQLRRTIFYTVLTHEHMVEKFAHPAHCYLDQRATAPRGPFDKADYYANPASYGDVFATRYLPHTSVLINGIYWESRFPRLVTIEQARAGACKRLIAIGDLGCDIKGPVEFFSHSTRIPKPFYMYDTQSGEEHERLDDPSRSAVLIGGVDHIPGEIPVDASNYFGDRFVSYVPLLAAHDQRVPYGDIKDMPGHLLHAMQSRHGRLVGRFAETVEASIAANRGEVSVARDASDVCD